jgi:hypothetical protein
MACLSGALIIILIFSGCPDPIRALDDIPVSLPSPDPDPDTTIKTYLSLKDALEDPDESAVTIGPGISLTIPEGVKVMSTSGSKTLIVHSSSLVVFHGLSVPAGAALSLKGEGDSACKIELDSLDIQGALSMDGNIQVTLGGSYLVGEGFKLEGGTLVVNKGGKIEGGDNSGPIHIGQGIMVFVDPGDNNFYRKIEGSKMDLPAGDFSWDSGKPGWVENLIIYPKNLQEFFEAPYSTTYVVTADEPLPGTDTIFKAAVNPSGVKTLVLNNSVAGDSLTLDAGARLKLEGTGTLTVKTIVLNQGAELEVGLQAIFSANTNKNSELKPGSKIVIRGTFHNDSMPGWTMGTGAEFVFHAGSRIHINKGSSLSEYFIGTANDGNKPIIILKDGSIVLGSGEFGLAEKGVAILNSDFAQPWPGRVYINGTLDLNAKFTVNPPGPPQESYFELAENARVLVNAGGELSVSGPSPSAGGSAKYGVLGPGSKIVVKNGGTFRNGIFPNWGHGSSGNPGAFVFEAGSKIYASTTAFGAGNSSEVLYIGNGTDSPYISLTKGQIRLTDKTFALEALGSTNGEAVLEKDLSLSGSRLVVDNSSLTIKKEFAVKNTSATEEFVTLAGAKILVKGGGKFIIAGPTPLPPGDVKLALLSSGSSITVENGGEFRNGVYPNWEMGSSGEFVFKSGSKVYKNSEASPFIGDSNSSPVRLANGTITYAYKKVTLDGKADVNGQTVLPLWAGFELVLEPNSVLTVNIPAGGFTLDGITVTSKPGAKIVYTTP